MVVGSTVSSMKSPGIKQKSQLDVHKLKGHDLFTVTSVLSASECDAFIKFAEAYGFSHQSSLGPAKGEAFRDNGRISLEDTALADNLWRSGISKCFSEVEIRGKRAVGLNPNIRFYRYREGQRFGPHIDESVDLGGGCRTEYTLLVYLNGHGKTTGKDVRRENHTEGQLLGGETVFYAGRKGVPIEVSPLRGLALLHLHGKQCMLHEARLVSKGTKYILRSDVVFG